MVKRWDAITADEFFDIVRLRTEVFFVEQRIDEPDFDDADRDPETLHHWMSDESGCTAYLRVTRLHRPEFGARRTFGRVAVRADQRRRGLAQLLIAKVLSSFGDEPLVIHAQEYVCELYAGFGFKVVGERYFEAGLPHLPMLREPR